MREYIQKLLRKEEQKVRTKLRYCNKKVFDNFIHLKNQQNDIRSCMYKIDFGNNLNEKEILLVNELLDKNKYNLILNRKFIKKKEHC